MNLVPSAFPPFLFQPLQLQDCPELPPGVHAVFTGFTRDPATSSYAGGLLLGGLAPGGGFAPVSGQGVEWSFEDAYALFLRTTMSFAQSVPSAPEAPAEQEELTRQYCQALDAAFMAKLQELLQEALLNAIAQVKEAEAAAEAARNAPPVKDARVALRRQGTVLDPQGGQHAALRHAAPPQERFR